MEDDPAKRISLGDHPRLRPVSWCPRRSSPRWPARRARGWSACSRGRRTPTSSGTTSRSACSATSWPRSTSGLIGSSHVATLEVADARRRRTRASSRPGIDSQDGTLGNLTDFTPKQLAELTSGLNLVNLERLLAAAAQSGKKLDAQALKRAQEGADRAPGAGLVEFVEPPHTLDDFVGNDAVKQRLADDAALLAKGRLDAAPMGYLICGPVGTGKTYLAECFAGSVGIPCVKLRNFRSKYVGETEGNLEQILNVLRAMGPVVVVIDEADAALGNREAGGDSGTSSRVFSMIASQMGDTRYRGKLLWMLLTSRPDLLPIDLKRQGRAEVHLPLFRPRDDAEVAVHDQGDGPQEQDEPGRRTPCRRASPAEGFSGADIESIVLSAKRTALTPRPRGDRRATTSTGPSRISSRRRRGWKKRNKSWRPCSNARRCRSCPTSGGRASPGPTAAPSSRSGWPPSAD